MTRLAILCEYPTMLGGERSMLSTLAAVREARFEISIAAPAAGPLADAVRKQGVRLVPWSDRAELVGLIERLRPDLVHANSLSTARLTGPTIAAAGVPSIGHLRDIVTLSRQAVDDINCHRQLVAVSNATRTFHAAQGVDAAKCAAIHNGVDLATFRPRPATGSLHAELGIPSGAPLVATVGQIGLRKGTDVALAAVRRVPGVHWLVVGQRTSEKEESREFERRLHEASREPDLAGRVHFLGQREDMLQLLPECRLLLHTARQEPLGRILLETAACGVPVVATDVGGTREIFPDDASGAILVKADAPDATAEAIGALLENENRRRTVGAAGRARAEAAFDVRIAAARLIDLYRRVLKL
ncbi:MAG: glycosyltransferase family 4 protein [Pirellulales bacterium]